MKAKAYKFIKKRLQHRYFPVNIRKCLRTSFFMEHFRWLLLKVMQRRHKKEYLLTKRSNQQKCFFTSLLKRNSNTGGCNFTKKRLQHRCFSVNIAKFLRTPILKNNCERLLLNEHCSVWENAVSFLFQLFSEGVRWQQTLINKCPFYVNWFGPFRVYNPWTSTIFNHIQSYAFHSFIFVIRYFSYMRRGNCCNVSIVIK